MKLTKNQGEVLAELRSIGRKNAFKYKDSQPYLHSQDLHNLNLGDQYCAFGLGGLTYQVAAKLGMNCGSVLAIFKALERKGLVIRETRNPEYKRPLYWWPVGFSEELLAELSQIKEESK